MEKNIFINDIESYLSKFKNLNFGDLAGLNKEDFTYLDFRNWSEPFGYSFIVIQEGKKDEFLSVLKEWLLQAKNYENEKLFKIYYFLSSLDVLYEEHIELLNKFFKNIGETKKKEIYKTLIKKINHLEIFPQLERKDLFEIEEYFSKYHGDFIGETIFKLFGDFYHDEFYPEIYDLRLEYFYALIIAGEINREIFLSQSNPYLSDLQKLDYNIMYIASLSDVRDLEEKYLEFVKNLLSQDQNITNVRCLKYFWKKALFDRYKIANKVEFRNIFLDVVEKEIQKQNQFLEEIEYGYELSLFILLLKHRFDNFKKETQEKILEVIFKKIKTHVEDMMSKENIKERVFNGVYLDGEEDVKFKQFLNKAIYFNDSNWKEWNRLLDNLKQFCMELYYTEEIEVRLEVNYIVAELLELNLAAYKTDQSTIAKISTSLEILQEDLLFKYLEYSLYRMPENKENLKENSDLEYFPVFKEKLSLYFPIKM